MEFVNDKKWGGMVVQWLALTPHIEKVVGLTPIRAFL